MSSSSSAGGPISPGRFASALKDLPLSSLHLKAAELRNSIAHLDYSNEQLLPFAEGRDPSSPSAAGVPDQDCVDAIRENEVVIARMLERIELLKSEVEGRGQVWIEGGVSGSSGIEAGEEEKEEQGARLGELVNGGINGSGSGASEAARGDGEGTATDSRSPWTDGTFQTGRIVNGEVRMDNTAATAPARAVAAVGGEGTTGVSGIVNANGVNGASGSSAAVGGRLDDEALRRAMEERMREVGQDEEEDGMHL